MLCGSVLLHIHFPGWRTRGVYFTISEWAKRGIKPSQSRRQHLFTSNYNTSKLSVIHIKALFHFLGGMHFGREEHRKLKRKEKTFCGENTLWTSSKTKRLIVWSISNSDLVWSAVYISVTRSNRLQVKSAERNNKSCDCVLFKYKAKPDVGRVNWHDKYRRSGGTLLLLSM
jgi:hypothetical protein